VVRHYKFEILAPRVANYDPAFAAYTVNDGVYEAKLDAVQRLRGRLYYQDGAIDDKSLDGEGRFRMCGDEEAWHLLLTDPCNTVVGCARYLVYPSTTPYRVLRISQSAIGQDPKWSSTLRSAVEADLRCARKRGLQYVEIGGWALSEEWRKTKAALETAAASYALGHLWGGTLGSCTATVRHGSASILRRIGGGSLGAHGRSLPPYFDPRFGCVMELLRFDYLTPWPRMRPMIEEMRHSLSTTPVLTARLDYVDLGGGLLGHSPFLREAM
jgi:hypothetical protein